MTGSKQLRRAPIALAAIAILLLASGWSSPDSRSAARAASILRIGTTYYVDTLNPFVGIETNDSTAYGMVYPQLVQYGPGLKLVGDWASSWSHSKDGLVWTFHLRTGKWSDGTPLTARDAVWTIQTVLKYRNGPASYAASVLDGVKGASAPNAQTLVLTYARPVAPVLANLEQFFILPEHVWAAHVGAKGTGLKGYHPEQSLPLVAGGAYTVSQFQEKGTTVFKPNPYFYGPKSRSAAVTLTYYTNPTSMTADMERGNLDYVDALPYAARHGAEGQEGDRRHGADRRRGDEPRLQLEPAQAEEPRAARPARQGGASSTRRRASSSSRSSSAATRSRGRTSSRRGRSRPAGSTRP